LEQGSRRRIPQPERLPAALLAELKALANKRDVPYQSLLKVFLSERIARETADRGIASLEDLLDFFARLPNPDKQFAVMPGIAHASFQQAAAVYRGENI
jgi:hypothetical protein